MKRNTSSFFAAVILSCLLLPRLSLSQSLPLKHYTIKDGLASSSVRSIFQDDKGFLWIGTEHGLSRFDGREFRNFNIEDGLRSDYIDDIWQDREGKIWVSTLTGGIGVFNSGRFRTFTKEDGLNSTTVYAVTGDRQGNMWIATHNGVTKYDGKNFSSYKEKDGLSNNIVYDIVCDTEGKPWFATFDGLSCLDKGRFINYSEKHGLVNIECKVLKIDSRGNIWVGTAGGLSCFKEGKFVSYTTRDGLAGNLVNTIIEDTNHNLWIGTDNGISYFAGGKFTNYSAKHGLPDDKVFTIFEDREKNIWFGTGMGLSKLHSLRIVNFSVKDGLPNNLAWAIAEEREGKYWFGTNMGLSCYCDGRFENYTVKDGLSSNSVYALMIDKKGRTWIGTDGGISIYTGGKFLNYSLEEYVLSLIEDSRGEVWIGTNRSLYRFDNGNFTTAVFEQAHDSIQALLIDRDGNLWFSNTKGLCKIVNDKITFYTVQDGLIDNNIKALFEDNRGRTWIGTNQGLSCFHEGKFTNYTTADGLSDNVCYFVLQDDDQHIWIGTGKGVNRFDGQSFKVYTSRDGLASDEMGQEACLKDSRGHLWFGTVDGITRFDPDLDRVNTVPPPVYITAFNLFGKEQPMSHNIELKHNRNYLNFSFIGISFTSPEDVTYKHRLVGIDPDWFEIDTPSVSYPYLPPGKYTFKVVAKNNDGVESVQPAEIKFRILPPFWATWWFRGLLIVTFLSIVAMVVFWRIKRFQEKLANEARNKQLIMAQKMELVGILAGGAVHDLKNLLSIIIGYSKLAVQHVDHEDSTSKPLEKIKNTAMTAVSVVKQILAFTRQKYDKTIAANLNNLVDDILEILKISTPAGITINWQPPDEKIRLYINPTKFQQVVMNLCLNAVQAIPGQGEVVISLNYEGARHIILEVTDNGTGMAEEVASKIFDPLYTTKEEGKGTGLGLFVVKQIVDERKGKIEVESKPGEGTTFRITFPCRESA